VGALICSVRNIATRKQSRRASIRTPTLEDVCSPYRRIIFPDVTYWKTQLFSTIVTSNHSHEWLIVLRTCKYVVATIVYRRRYLGWFVQSTNQSNKLLFYTLLQVIILSRCYFAATIAWWFLKWIFDVKT